MKRVLVTGIAGFIGAQTTRELLRQGVDVVGVDNLNEMYDPRLKEHRLHGLRDEYDFEFHQLDIEDKESLRVLLRSRPIDAIFNLAGRAGVRSSLETPQMFLATNTVGNVNLLDCAVEFGVPKFVLASTSALYAGAAMPFAETSPVSRPVSAYAVSKLGAEAICYTYHHQYGLDCSVLRYFTVYGPAGRPDMAVFRFIRWIDEGAPLEIYGDGGQKRDFTFIDDIARANVLAARPFGYEVFNLGCGGAPVSLNRVIARIEERLGKKARRHHAEPQRVDMADTAADVSKAAKVLGWRAQTAIDEGLDHAVDWYLANREFVRKLLL